MYVFILLRDCQKALKILSKRVGLAQERLRTIIYTLQTYTCCRLISSKEKQNNHVCCKIVLFKYTFYFVLVFVVKAATEILICENFNCLYSYHDS